MYLAERKGAGGSYLYVQATVLKKGKSSVITVLKLGRKDLYLQEHGENSLDELRERIKHGDFEHLLPDVYQKDLYKDRVKVIHGSTNISSLLANARIPLPNLNYCHFYINQIFERELELTRKLNSLLKYEHPKAKLPLAAAVKCMVVLRMLQPNSKVGDFNNRFSFLGGPFDDVKLEDFYKSLTYLSEFKDRLFAYLHTRHANCRDLSLVLYDATNIYFESPYTDSEYMIINLRRFLINKGLCSPGDNIQERFFANDKPEVKAAIEDFLSRYEEYEAFEDQKQSSQDANVAESSDESDQTDAPADGKEPPGKKLLRARSGANKQKRYDLPQIMITLIADRNGVPVDFEIHTGNHSEFKTLKPSIEAFRQRYGIAQTELFAADRGLNSRDNILAVKNNGIDSLMSQRIDLLNIEWMGSIDHTDPKYKPGEGSALTPAELAVLNSGWDKIVYTYHDGEFIPVYKENFIDYQLEMEVPVEDVKDQSLIVAGSVRTKRGKEKKEVCTVAIPAKLLITWSKSRADLDLASLNRCVEKASRFIKTNKTLDTYGGFKQLIKVTVLDSNGKEVAIRQADAKKAGYNIKMELRDDLIERRSKMAGCYAYICTNTALQPDEIKKQYKQLLHIEESFKLLKCQLRARPAYVRTTDHIKGHVAMCMIALVILRRMQQIAQEKGMDISFGHIVQGLRSCQVLPTPQQNDLIAFVRNTPALTDRYSQEDAAELSNLIADIFGMEQVNSLSDKTALSNKLKTKFSSAGSLLGQHYLKLLKDHQINQEPLPDAEYASGA